MSKGEIWWCNEHGKETEPNVCGMAYRVEISSPAHHSMMLDIHARALAAHCECLGMNAENCTAACLNKIPPFHNDAYIEVMQKWGLINEKGEPLI